MIPGRIHERDGVQLEVSIELSKATLQGTLNIPKASKGVVLFAHGSGSSRFSPRNRFVANELHSHDIATLLFDLLTPEEETIDERTLQLRFNISLLAKRLIGATRWMLRDPEMSGLAIGYFGASTGAAAALVAAAQLPDKIAAIVSRGGRPDLSAEALGQVRAPTLLIVGGNDEPVINMNQWALAELQCAEKKLVTIPGAGHLFEEPGTLAAVARMAAEWFTRHFAVTENAHSEKRAGQ